MASEMNDWPTGVRTTVPPWRFATSSMARVVETFVTTVPGSCASAMAVASVSRPLLGERRAVGGDEADALAVGIVRETDVGTAGAHDGLQLRHRFGLRLGPMGKGRRRDRR